MSAAFHEVKYEPPTPGEPHHRWFQSDYFDLFLWYDATGALCRFQLCYDRYSDEHALTWVQETNDLTHQSVDGGERFFGHGASGLLAGATKPPPPSLAEDFRVTDGPVPQDARQLIQRALSAATACADRAPRR